MIEFFAEYKTVIIILHAFAAAVGIGSATISDLIFFTFLKDGKISENESRILWVLTRFVWLGIVGLGVTGLGLFLGDPSGYMMSSKFIVKMIIVGIIGVNGAFLTAYMHQRMLKINFSSKLDVNVKKLAFASGAISVSSWYLAFLLGSLRSIPFTVAQGMLVYALVVCLGILFSQCIYYRYQKKYSIEDGK